MVYKVKRWVCTACWFLLLAGFSLVPYQWCHAELIDRVVAFVNDMAITKSELNETYEGTKRLKADISVQEVLTTMINRMLLLNEARKMKLEGKADEDILNEYIELRVRAYIRFTEEDMEGFYKDNLQEFQGASYESVRNKIEEFLTEREINKILKRHIAELRSKAYVKVLID